MRNTLCCGWVGPGTRELDPWAKINQNRTRNRQKISVSSRTGLGTGRSFQSLLKHFNIQTLKKNIIFNTNKKNRRTQWTWNSKTVTKYQYLYVNEFYCIFIKESTHKKMFNQELEPWAKVLQNRPKIYGSSRTGPGTARYSKSILEPEPELVEILTR